MGGEGRSWETGKDVTALVQDSRGGARPGQGHGKWRKVVGCEGRRDATGLGLSTWKVAVAVN